MIKLVIFDLDGTLVDSATDIMHAANEYLATLGMKPLTYKEIRDHIGEGFGSFVRHAAGDRGADPKVLEQTFKEFQAHYDQRLVNETRLFEGAEHFLRETLQDKTLKVGIVSNKPEYQVRRILKELGYKESDFVQIYGGDTFEVKKPHPKPLQEMMRLAGVEPGQTVMIGDSKADIHAAKAAGTHAIAVTFGYNSREMLESHGAEHFIDHFNELRRKVEALKHSAS